jgi:SpoU rRNA Methylase family
MPSVLRACLAQLAVAMMVAAAAAAVEALTALRGQHRLTFILAANTRTTISKRWHGLLRDMQRPLQCQAAPEISSAISGPSSSTVRKEDAVGIAAVAHTTFPAVILVRTTLPENMGACARAMLNFGLVDLRLVAPQCDPLAEVALRRAAGAEGVLRLARRFDSVADAVADLGMVYATTARTRDMVSLLGCCAGHALVCGWHSHVCARVCVSGHSTLPSTMDALMSHVVGLLMSCACPHCSHPTS